jgi:hypothetical protein
MAVKSVHDQALDAAHTLGKAINALSALQWRLSEAARNVRIARESGVDALHDAERSAQREFAAVQQDYAAFLHVLNRGL